MTTIANSVAAALRELADYAEMAGENPYAGRATQGLCKTGRWCKIWLPGSAA